MQVKQDLRGDGGAWLPAGWTRCRGFTGFLPHTQPARPVAPEAM